MFQVVVDEASFQLSSTSADESATAIGNIPCKAIQPVLAVQLTVPVTNETTPVSVTGSSRTSIQAVPTTPSPDGAAAPIRQGRMKSAVGCQNCGSANIGRSYRVP